MGSYADEFGKVILKEKPTEDDLTKIREVFGGVTVEGDTLSFYFNGNYYNMEIEEALDHYLHL